MTLWEKKIFFWKIINFIKIIPADLTVSLIWLWALVVCTESRGSNVVVHHPPYASGLMNIGPKYQSTGSRVARANTGAPHTPHMSVYCVGISLHKRVNTIIHIYTYIYTYIVWREYVEFSHSRERHTVKRAGVGHARLSPVNFRCANYTIVHTYNEYVICILAMPYA